MLKVETCCFNAALWCLVKANQIPRPEFITSGVDLFQKTIAGETEAFDDLHLQV